MQNINNVLNTSLTLRNLRIPHRNIELIGEMFCNEDSSTDNGTFYWPMTKIGKNVTIPCHANVARRHCSSRKAVDLEIQTNQNMISRECSPFTGIWQEPDMSQCYNTEWITRQLKNITSQDIDEENVEPVSTKLLNISEKSVYFKAEDIDLAVDTLEKMVPLISNVSVNITLNNILPSINYMINKPEEVLVEAGQSERTGERMLDVIEIIPEKIPLEKQQVAVSYSNLAIGAAKVDKDTFNGLIFAVSYGTNETKARSEIYNNSNSQVEDVMDFISLPKSLLKHLNDEEQSSLSRISFLSMHEDKLYKVTQKSSPKANAKINSHIIAANIPNVQITKLDEPIRISFNVIDPDLTNPQCVYWHESPEQNNSHWSTEDCDIATSGPGEKVLCSCHLLTSYALLMESDENEGDTKNNHLLSFISSGISLLCLILTMIVHVCSTNLWKLTDSKMLVNMCSSLTVANLVFVVGLLGYGTEITAVCKAMAVLIHYFILTSLMWKVVEAFHIYLDVVRKTYQTSSVKRSSILAWGLPAVIVIITLATNDTNNYIRIGQFCWLPNSYFYGAFLGPVMIILTFNITMFFLVMYRLISKSNDKKFEHASNKARIFGMAGSCLLLGVPCILAFLLFDKTTKLIITLLAIFSVLQGLFIFIFYCICKKDARHVVCLCLCKRNKVHLSQAPKDIRSSSSGNVAERKTEEANL
ncbi:adhesion G-protein coupled receptor G6 [Octopus bimaculoides]|uniref:G-protein coupled receptors family 2 profile 2 domain-containing protein n=1 Tax=Octopus bimaculoides TaxID=37653 RepID=A0A0L8GB41_OCTBM|nr:adhesion G-protein coupled receptor G6 [Octopus bimaculoides]|eukprot:XP_014782543.1 PREDICTED: G-protein coupled receptor 126-like [Octopus bimaculoides]